MNDWSKFDQEEKPAQSDFHDSLKNEACSNADYSDFSNTFAVKQILPIECGTFVENISTIIPENVLSLLMMENMHTSWS